VPQTSIGGWLQDIGLGQFARLFAEQQIEVEDSSWSPYLSVADATRLDKVRDALRRGDLKAAASLARVYRLEPVAPTH